MARLFLLVVVAACGRLHFDPVPLGGDADDAASAGIPERRITFAPGESTDPSLAWSGSGWGIAWRDTRTGDPSVYFARLDAEGVKQGGDVLITPSGGARAPALVWTGGEFALVWEDDRSGNSEIYFARLDSSGNKIGGDVRLTDDPAASVEPKICWTGAEYAIAWVDFRTTVDAIYFARVDATGAKLGGDVQVTTRGLRPAIEPAGGEMGIAWMANNESFFARMDAAGTKQGSDVQITTTIAGATNTFPKLAWTGTDYGYVWRQDLGSGIRLFFGRMDPMGNRLGGDVPVSSFPGNDLRNSLVWTGAGYAAAWHDKRNGLPQIFLAWLDSSGTLSAAGEVEVSTATNATSNHPTIAWSGAHAGVAWQDDRDGNVELYFRLEPP